MEDGPMARLAALVGRKSPVWNYVYHYPQAAESKELGSAAAFRYLKFLGVGRLKGQGHAG